MINYMNILDIWNIIERGYITRFNEIAKKLIVKSKIDKKNNDYIVNIILNSVSESKRSLFDDMTSAYENNDQVKTEVKNSRLKLRDE
jgi:hypothetical protein